MDDGAYDAGDPKAIKQAEAKVALRDQERLNVVLDLLKSRQGREWAWSILLSAGVFATRQLMDGSYANGFEEGRREVGTSLMLYFASKAPKQFAQMLAENFRD